jgi:hypothetical protein
MKNYVQSRRILMKRVCVGLGILSMIGGLCAMDLPDDLGFTFQVHVEGNGTCFIQPVYRGGAPAVRIEQLAPGPNVLRFGRIADGGRLVGIYFWESRVPLAQMTLLTIAGYYVSGRVVTAPLLDSYRVTCRQGQVPIVQCIVGDANSGSSASDN